jgi:Na+-transporting NADH:ubiquinone oxidoreductase subunit NqrC
MGMTLRVRIALCLLCAFFVLCIVMALSPAYAESAAACTDYKTLQAALMQKFHEQPTAAGLAGEKSEIAWTLFESPKGESWTMVIVDTKGRACVIGTGENWTDLSAGKGDPT